MDSMAQGISKNVNNNRTQVSIYHIKLTLGLSELAAMWS